ncbi:MAG TPA: CGNR zinc finger domain-containing protein [Anaerolineales bacterium]|nr:CGNR zinc finger domain-containing protein [Anaerolineales bacterium]
MTETTRTLQMLELVGGALCLDFVNTINSRIHPEHDYLLGYFDLVGWANKVGILFPTQTSQLQKRARQNADEAQSALKAAHTLRDLLYRLFSKAAEGSEPDKKDMEIFVVFYGESISRSQLIRKETHYTTTWKMDEALEAVLWPIIHSAGELLLSEELGHLKECPGCGWLFLDTSKNQSRRWCSMNTCGARDKMRRYHRRKRAK